MSFRTWISSLQLYRGLRSRWATRRNSRRVRTRRLFFEPLEARVVLDGDFGYALGFGSKLGTDSGRAVDVNGNVYITGSFQGSPDFDPGPGTVSLDASDSDIFVAKYSPTGELGWVRGLGGTSADQGVGIAVDSSGNVYTTGTFQGTADFDPGAGTFNLTSGALTDDVFVSKLDSAGNFVYARRLGGTSADQAGGIEVDSTGNVYTTGTFSGTADFDPGAGTSNLVSFGGSIDIFVSKLDSAGNFVYVRQLGGTSTDQAGGIAVDSSGNMYTTGSFQGTVDFDPGAGIFNLTSVGNTDSFVYKLDSAGNFVYASQLGGTSTEQGSGIVVDVLGNVYTTGNFGGTVDFDPGAGTFNLMSAGVTDAFVSKLDSAGAFVYARRLGGTMLEQGFGITVDGSGNVYTTGIFTGTVDFDPGPGAFNLTNSFSTTDIFVSKLDSAGNFVYARQFGGQATDRGSGIAVDSSGNVYTTGVFASTVDFDPGVGVFNLTSAFGSNDIFLSKLDSAGNFSFAFAVGGGGGNDVGRGVAVDSSGNVYVTGEFAGAVDFDPGPGATLLTSFGILDAFVAKFSPLGALEWVRQLGGASDDRGLGIALDSSGNVYTTGVFAGTADFDPGANTFNLISAGLAPDIFVSKLDSAGNFVYARRLGGTSADQGNGIAVDGSGNVYTTGNFFGTADFDPGAATFNLTALSLDIFVSKLDSAGNFVYACRFGGTSIDIGSGIAVDGSGNAYTTGIFAGTADFDPGPGTLNLASFGGSTDVFVSKLDSAGNLVYARGLGGTAFDQGVGIAVDGSGNAYTTGIFAGTVDFDPGPGAFNLTSVTGANDVFISKLDSAGAFVYARGLGGATVDQAGSIAVDSSGSVYTTGSFQGTADFDPGAGTFFLTSFGLPDVFVSKLDSAGNFVSARRFGGTSSEQGNGIAVDSSGNVYTTGNFSGTTDFDPGAGTFNLTGAGGADIFVSKLTATVSIVASDPTGSEPANDGEFTVSLDGGNVAGPGGVTLTYSVSGSASSGSDYAALSGTATIPQGSSSATIAVVVMDDNLAESSETVVVTLTGTTVANGSTLAVNSTSNTRTVTITDNDASVVSVTGTADGVEGSSHVVFRITQSLSNSTPTVVNYTLGGSATPGIDFLGASGSTVTIPANVSTVSVTLPVIDDALVEGNETIVLTLSSPTVSGSSAVSVNTTPATRSILDNDTAGPSMVSIFKVFDAAEPSTFGIFRVTLSSASPFPTAVFYTMGGTGCSLRDALV